MNRPRIGSVTAMTALVLGVTTACSDDPVSQNPASQSVARGANLASSGGLAGPNDRGPKRYIAVLDDCDPNDPGWAPTGGCTRKDGVVTFAEFNAFLSSPRYLSTVGHPAWRNEPSYVKIEPGESVRVTNEGGRTHTFTQVADFGGGRVPQLNIGLSQAPECVSASVVDMPPGATITVDGLGIGTHKFQCCIHPWMRAAVKVLPDDKGKQS